jgi:putative ABC transport system permease protein
MIQDEVAHTIVGVMPRGFDFPNETRLWTTLPDSDRERGRNNQFAYGVARLKPGVTLASAQSDMEVLQEQLNELHPIEGRNYGANLVSLHDETVGDVRSALFLLLGAVGVFLAIACANITNLLLLRASERRKELAVRLSIGAGRGRLLGQLLTEGFVLSVLGGALGLLLAFASL